MRVALGPTALFPLRLRLPIAICLCATEFGLGIALILTAGRYGAGLPAALVRVATTLLFLIAVAALVELRERGRCGVRVLLSLSVTPVGARTIARSALLAVAAVAAIGQAPLRMPISGSAAVLRIGLLAAEFLLIAALSPEIGEAMRRLGYSEPCEVRRVSVERTLTSLSGSAQWRRYGGTVVSAAPGRHLARGMLALRADREVDGRRMDVGFGGIPADTPSPSPRRLALDAVTLTRCLLTCPRVRVRLRARTATGGLRRRQPGSVRCLN